MHQKYIILVLEHFWTLRSSANDPGHTLGKPPKLCSRTKMSAHTFFKNFLDVGVFLALFEGF